MRQLLLRKSQAVPVGSSLSGLMPELDLDGVLRSNSRLSLVEILPYDTRFSIILPRKNPVTRLVVKNYRDLGKHALGTNHLLSLMSEKYWVVHGREEIRECERNCKTCQRTKAKAATQVTAPLPPGRATVSLKAFNSVAVHYTGPFLTMQGCRKTRQKRYLCLFTCLSTRAVHCKIAYGMDTDKFLNALSRFVNQHGKPDKMMSDNDSNLIGAERELRDSVKSLDQARLKNATSHEGIKWSSSPPLRPHFGGVHESLIKTAKRTIYAILRNADVTDEELHSAFVGAEAILNSRPLTYMSASPKDLTRLTPSHFLHGSLGNNVAPEKVLDTTPLTPGRGGVGCKS